ncbi:Mn-containing catalase [Desulfitobacterium dichloroeliminans LMG P-21439]|uniref:Mn-containing catalase n=1 Tax=Desulfitobacterium dichloroeliminans (strain LMG P-21439 / DCA1) TaxID=871963 RepID=L0F703_DESDL|nr:manganese catalase family protein [Desulfitobacterium dichloroeliminans]AGA68738.1 Mn-containing catalase [Desulfitobacterium dichloroeliminans LMG P-21439]
MYSYRKRFFYPIHVEGPDPVLAKQLIEHYGGKDGELTQVVQYLNHQVNIDNRYIRELLGLISAEELAHLETLSAMIIKLGGEVHRLVNASDQAWSLANVYQYSESEKILRANVALEKRARLQYEEHANLTQDPGVKRLLSFLARREGIHQKLLYRCHKVMMEGGSSEHYMGIIYDYKMSLQVLD